MSDIVPMLNHWARRLGWPMLAGVALAGMALAFYVGVCEPADRHLHALELEAAHMQNGAGQRRPVWVQEAPRAALQNFYRMLPREKSTPDLLEKIFDAAYENNITLEQGQFKLAREQGVAFSQYQIVFPATGSYADIRKFVNRVLQEIPSAALDGIDFSREDVKSPEVEAQVRFTLYLGVGR